MTRRFGGSQLAKPKGCCSALRFSASSEKASWPTSSQPNASFHFISFHFISFHFISRPLRWVASTAASVDLRTRPLPSFSPGFAGTERSLRRLTANRPATNVEQGMCKACARHVMPPRGVRPRGCPQPQRKVPICRLIWRFRILKVVRIFLNLRLGHGESIDLTVAWLSSSEGTSMGSYSSKKKQLGSLKPASASINSSGFAGRSSNSCE